MRNFVMLLWLGILNLGFPFALLAQPPQAPLTFTWHNTTTAATLQAHRIPNTSQTEPTTWQLQGLPFPGTVLWRPATQQMAYQHPTEVSWLVVNVSALPRTPTPILIPAAKGKPWQGAATQRIAVLNAPGASEPNTCGALFTASTLGEGLSITSLHNVHALLAWLNSGQTPSGCAAPYALQAGLGLPTYWASPWGVYTLQTMQPTPEPLTLPTWPQTIYPVTPEVRLRLLLAQIPIPARALFLQQYAHLPLLAQIETLSNLLAAATAAAAHP